MIWIIKCAAFNVILFDTNEIKCVGNKFELNFSFQFFIFSPPLANLVLHRTIERIHVDKKFGDIDIGVIIIRGKNVVLCGEIVSQY